METNTEAEQDTQTKDPEQSLLTRQQDYSQQTGRRIKIMFARDLPQMSDLSIMFGIDETKLQLIEQELTDLFNFIMSNEGFVKIDEIIDGETEQPSDLLITISGSQMKFAEEFKAHRLHKFISITNWQR